MEKNISVKKKFVKDSIKNVKTDERIFARKFRFVKKIGAKKFLPIFFFQML
jgi:hypothetical protein